jgi:FG-GAP-like repeat
LGNGDGTFQTAKITPTPPEVDTGDGSLVIRDFNGDGMLDIASGAAGVLLLGNGNGTFQPPIPLGMVGRGLAAGRFSRDGKLDLADTGVTVLRNISSDFWWRR